MTNRFLTLLAFFTLTAYAQFTPFPPNPVEEGTLSTKGDLLSHDGNADLVLPKGADGYVLKANSSSPSGLEWSTPASTSPTDTRGDIIYNNTGTPAGDTRLAIGVSGQVLTVTAGGLPSWAEIPINGTTLDTKGQVQGFSTSLAPVGPCVDGEVLEYDSSIGTGWKCSPIPTSTNLSQKGDIQTFDGTSNVAQSVGADGTFLVADSSSSTGLSYSAALSGKLNPVTDWKDYTPTIQGLGTVSNVSGKYKRVGDSLLLKVFFDSGTVTSSLSGFSLPSGLNIDSTKLTRSSNTSAQTGTMVGSYEITESVSNSNGKLVTATGTNSTLIYFGASSRNSSNGLVPANGNVVMASNVGVSLVAKVPIQGWTSGLDAAVQNIEKTMFNSDVLSAYFDGNSPSLSSRENFDGWILNNSCTRSATSLYTCSHPVGLFTALPTCWGSIEGNYINTASINIISQTLTSTVYETVGTSGNFATAHTLYCSKSQDDVNKSQVIAGTFQNINSTEIAILEAEFTGTGGSVSITGNTTDLPFGATRDNYSAWDGSGYNAPKDGLYLFEGTTNMGTGDAHYIKVYIDGVDQQKFVSQLNVNSNYKKFQGFVYLEKDERFSLRIQSNNTLNNSNQTYLKIVQSADYEAIVKNLYDEKKECQTKVLQSNISSTTSNVADLKFNNLEIGKKYSIYIAALISGGDQYGQLRYRATESSGDQLVIVGSKAPSPSSTDQLIISAENKCYTATSTELFADYFDNGSSVLEGNGSANGNKSETHATLCELPASTICNSNKWD